MAEKEIVVNLRLAETGVREQFNRLKAALIDVKQEVAENNKALRDNAKEQKAVEAELKKGKATAEQAAAALQFLKTERDKLKAQAATLASAEAGLSAQYREARNDVGGLTEANLRFRDVMAQASLKAIEQSSVLQKLGTRMEFIKSEQDRLNAEYAQTETQLRAIEKEQTSLNDSLAQGKITQQQYATIQAQLNEQYKQGKLTQDQYVASSNKLEAELGQLNAQTTDLRAKFDALGKELKEGRITVDEFRTRTAALEQSVVGVGAAVTRGVADLKNFALGFVGVVAVAQGAISAIKSIASTIADFDQQLANIRSLGGEYAASIDRIAQAAVELGPKLGIAPVEALKGFEELAKAGLTTEQILTGGLEAALTLAAAGTLEVGQAAELTASTLTQFNLQGEEAGKIADLLAKGANIAQGGVGDLGAALNQSGLVAAQFGLSVEETVGALTLFAQAGLIGSDAGTSFRSALLRLQNPTKEARDVLNQYGIELVDAQGNFLDLATIAGQLQTRLSGLTEEQRGAALATIFGQDAIRVANILYKEGAESVASYTRQVNDSGFASGVAGERLNSLQGSVSQLGASWDRFVLSVEKGDGVIGKSLRAAVDFVRDLVDALADLNGQGPLSEAINKAQSEVKNFQGLGRDLNIGARNFAKEIGQLEGQIAKLRKQEEDNERLFRPKAAAFNREQIAATEAQIEALKKEQVEYALRLKALAENKGATDKDTAANNTNAVSIETVAAARKRLNEELAAAKARRDALAATDTAGLAKANAEVASLEKQVAKLEGTGKGAADVTANVAGSVADLQARIAELRSQQAQSTSSEQFATYQAQIDTLTQSVDVLTGKLSQDFVDAANAIPVPQDVIISTSPLAPATPEGVDVVALQAQQQLESINSLEEFLAIRNELTGVYNQEQLDLYQAQFEAERALDDAKIDAAFGLANALATLTTEGTDAAKVAFGLQKALAIADVIIKTQREIAGYYAAYSLLPGGAAIATSQATAAKIRAGISIATIAAQAIKGFDQGGYTSPGHRLKPAGIVHAGEWVAPQWQVNHPHFGRIIEMLEQARASRSSFNWSDGYATGGPVITRGTALVNATAPSDLLNIENAVSARLAIDRPVIAQFTEFLKVQDRYAKSIQIAEA